MFVTPIETSLVFSLLGFFRSMLWYYTIACVWLKNRLFSLPRTISNAEGVIDLLLPPHSQGATFRIAEI